MSDYLNFIDCGKSKSGLTKIWEIQGTSGIIVGHISWFSGWRKYCFYPLANTTFDSICLDLISQFCKDQNILHSLPSSSQEQGK